MTTIHARQIQLTKMQVRKTNKVLYTVSNIFSHHIAHTFLPQSFDFHHFTTHIYPSHYTPLSPVPYAALHYTVGLLLYPRLINFTAPACYVLRANNEIHTELVQSDSQGI